ncbi:hypothetical protein GCM10017687_59300 [Streptomyces echinatus]
MMSFQTVIDVSLAVLAAAGDPLFERADATSVSLAELRDRALICLPRGTGVRTALERACRRAGFPPRIAFEAAAPDVLVQLAARGWASRCCRAGRVRRGTGRPRTALLRTDPPCVP